MASVFISNFGPDPNGIYTWKINGTRKDLEHLLTEIRREEPIFFSLPKIEHVRKQEYTVLLRLLIIREGVAVGDNQDPNSYDEKII